MYLKTSLPFDAIPQFSDRDKAYQNSDPRLRPFYEHEVDIDSFASVIENRKRINTDRELVYEILSDQYLKLDTSTATKSNIESLLQENSFTIVTAHQPSLLTGPLYYIYKICSTISLCKQLNSHYKNSNFIPVFVTGGEDHDFEEISKIHVFNRDFEWKTDQVGATGRMSLDGLPELLDQVKDTFGSSPYAEQLETIIDHAFHNSENYGQFMIHLTNSLFGKYGLVLVNMDDRRLKNILLPYIIKDIQEEASVKCVQKDQELLNAAGFGAQAHARDVNIFWHDGDRHRVIKTNGHYHIGDHSYSQEELIQLLQSKPESISPNVILRSVYQEIVLPNLAYIGGGGELAYWIERRCLFKEWNIPFPMLIRRDSVLILDKKSSKTLDESGISTEQLFDREEQILGAFAKSQSDVTIDLSKYKRATTEIFLEIKKLASQVDPTLSKAVGAESAKSLKSIDMIEQKMLRAAKQNNEVQLKRISKIKRKYFPNNDSLQERYDNFIPFYLRYGQAWIDDLVQLLDPMDKHMKILQTE